MKISRPTWLNLLLILTVNVFIFAVGITFLYLKFKPDNKKVQVVLDKNLSEYSFIITDELTGIPLNVDAEFEGESTVIYLPKGAYTINIKDPLSEDIVQTNFLAKDIYDNQDNSVYINLNLQANDPEINDSDFIPSELPFVSPVSDQSCDGYTILRGFSAYHSGIDYAKQDGCWINSVGDGTVVYARWDETGYGFITVIDHGNGIKTFYGNGDGTFLVKEGDTVTKGQKIMYMGNTGNSLETHLHFSMSAGNDDILTCIICRIDPLLYLN